MASDGDDASCTTCDAETQGRGGGEGGEGQGQLEERDRKVSYAPRSDCESNLSKF